MRPPGGGWIREDTGVYQGWEVTPFYDSLLSKLVSWGKNREEAIERMTRALKEYCILGVPTNIPFHSFTLGTKEFQSGDYSTAFIGSVFTPLMLSGRNDEGRIPAVLASLFAFWRDQERKRGVYMASAGTSTKAGAASSWAISGRREAMNRYPVR